MSLIGPASAALSGLTRQIAGVERAAADVVKQTTSESRTDSVSLSEAARSAPESQKDGVEAAMIDLRVSKYMAVANMKVMKAVDELQRTAEEIVR